MTAQPRCSAALLLIGVLAACDRTVPTAVAEPSDSRPVALAAVSCTARTDSPEVRCGTASLEGSGLVMGGQGTYVQLSDGNDITYTPADSTFRFTVTVQNLIPQALGTVDGVTPHSDSVRVGFMQVPAGPGGTIDIVNANGTATFTAANQPFFQYEGLLQTNQTSSAREWRFRVPPTVTTFTFMVVVGAAVQFPDGWVDLTPATDTLAAGAATSLSATVRSAVGNPVPGQTVTFGTGDAGVATVDAGGLVTAVAPGRTLITATSGTRTGGAMIEVCPNLSLGAVMTFDMPAGSSFCLAGGASGAEYVVVPANVSEPAAVNLGFTGAGIVGVSGAPTPGPARLGAGRALRLADRAPERDLAFESALRRRERRELGGLTRGLTADPTRNRLPRQGGIQRAITPGVPGVGSLMNLNVETDNSCSTNDIRTGRVMAVGTHAIVIADTMNPVGGLSNAQYQAVADSFDRFIHPVVTSNFGPPADIDANQRVIAFYTRAVNELTPPGSPSFVGGFVFSRDLFPAASCPTSNVGEMFYMLAADPAGTVNGNVRSVNFVLDQTFATLGHEYEHLINASRRMYVNTPWNGQFEEKWLDEGLAHVSEELLFYAATAPSPTPAAPGQNLGVAQIGGDLVLQDAFFAYAESNFGRLRHWLLAPHASGAFQTDDDVATRGAAWAFLRYAADRRGGPQLPFWSGLVNTGNTGLVNLQAVLGTDPLPWYRDFSAAMYLDDAGVGGAAPYLNPSWDFRSLYSALDYNPGPSCSCAYELAVRDPANGVTDAFTLANGGAAAYLRTGVAANAFAGISVLSGGIPPATNVRLTLIRRK